MNWVVAKSFHDNCDLLNFFVTHTLSAAHKAIEQWTGDADQTEIDT